MLRPWHPYRLQESRKWRKFYDDQRRSAWETSPAAPRAAPISKAPPALLNLHEELKKHDVIILDSDDDEPGPKKPRPGERTSHPAACGGQHACASNTMHARLSAHVHAWPLWV